MNDDELARGVLEAVRLARPNEALAVTKEQARATSDEDFLFTPPEWPREIDKTPFDALSEALRAREAARAQGCFAADDPTSTNEAAAIERLNTPRVVAARKAFIAKWA